MKRSIGQSISKGKCVIIQRSVSRPPVWLGSAKVQIGADEHCVTNSSKLSPAILAINVLTKYHQLHLKAVLLNPLSLFRTIHPIRKRCLQTMLTAPFLIKLTKIPAQVKPLSLPTQLLQNRSTPKYHLTYKVSSSFTLQIQMNPLRLLV